MLVDVLSDILAARRTAGVAALPVPLLAEPVETQEKLDFCCRHKITCDIEVIPIQKVNEAYERVLKSDVRYRFVIDMASPKSQ